MSTIFCTAGLIIMALALILIPILKGKPEWLFHVIGAIGQVMAAIGISLYFSD